jgi:hypothetical protein
MRKKIVGRDVGQASTFCDERWLELEKLARVELTSEDLQNPIESALSEDVGTGWRAQQSGEQWIRFVFDLPQQIRHIRLLFREPEQQRTQEFVLRWSADAGRTWREIVRQQYHFSPPDTTDELEDYKIDLDHLTMLELRLIPDISGGQAFASLAQLRIA